MSPESKQQEVALRQEVERSEQHLQALRNDLAAADRELEQLAEVDHQFVLLHKACRSLRELDEIGAGHLLWADGDDVHEFLHDAQGKVDAHRSQVIEIEERRQGLVAQIDDRNILLDELEFDLEEMLEAEEARQNEWLIEREAGELPAVQSFMPWARGFEEDKRFNRSLGSSLAASVALMFLVATVALPVIERTEELEVPDRVARLVRQEIPKPPEPEPEPIVEPLPEEEPEPIVAEELPEEIPEEAIIQPILAEDPQPDSREQVKSKGILAFRENFANAALARPAADLGSQARLSNAGENAVGRPQRAMVTTNAAGSSGGINLADISRDVGGGGGGIGGVEVTRVASSIGGNGTADRPLAGGNATAGRTDEEIQIVFDRYKASLYRLYNRELRKDPTLRGQMVIRLTIEPDGTVSMCQLQSTDMNAPVLVEQVIGRVGGFDFGAKEDIAAITIIYPIDFLPSA